MNSESLITPRTKLTANVPEQSVSDWQERLLLRRNHFSASSGSERDFAVQIDHAGLGYNFLLGKPDPQPAAVKAQEIYKIVTKQGWSAAWRTYPRELTVGFEGGAPPILCTFTPL